MFSAPAILIVSSLLLMSGGLKAASRFEDFTKKFESTPDRASVVTASYLGTTGTEWLAGGGFQPDGTVVLGGVSLGPDLNFGTPAVVVGRDGPIFPPARVLKQTRRGLPEVDKEGQTRFEPFTWKHPNATAFIVRLSNDAKEIKSVTRFSWKSGGLTSMAIDNSGDIYLCGPATPPILNISSERTETTVTNSPPGRYPCTKIYLAKLKADGSAVLWLRVINGPSHAPLLELLKGEKIVLQGPDLRVFDLNGKLLSAVPIPGGLGARVAMSPIDGTMARGGEHHSSTGREPYRDPTLAVYHPDGRLWYDLYHWDGPLVGLNDFRLVSDSAIRGVVYDAGGNLILHAWSDGGNSVLLREPNDLSTMSRKMEGLGFTSSGAAVLSCSYLIKINPTDYKISAGTLWLAYLKERDKPNSARINSLALASDGSICFGGSSATGLIQTGNALGTEPTGNYVAVLNSDFNSLRFSSALPACGQNDLNDSSPDGVRWGIASATVGGKSRVLFVSGAVEKDGTNAAPSVSARQSAYGGGLLDGHFLLLELPAREGGN